VTQYPSRTNLFEGGPKNPSRAHRWSSWCWLSTPSRGLVLGVKGVGRPAMACGTRTPPPWRPKYVGSHTKIGWSTMAWD